MLCSHCAERAGFGECHVSSVVKGVMTRSIADALSELCTPFLKGGNSAFLAAIASGLFPQTESVTRITMAQIEIKWDRITKT